MKKVNLNNLYESQYPPTDINTLWVDRDETTGKIRAIHRYNKNEGKWEPDMVSVDYMKSDEEDLDAYSDIYFQLPEGTEDSAKQVIKAWLDSEGFLNSDELLTATSPVLVESRRTAYSTITLARALHEDFDTAAVIGQCFKIIKSPKNS